MALGTPHGYGGDLPPLLAVRVTGTHPAAVLLLDSRPSLGDTRRLRLRRLLECGVLPAAESEAHCDGASVLLLLLLSERVCAPDADFMGEFVTVDFSEVVNNFLRDRISGLE